MVGHAAYDCSAQVDYSYGLVDQFGSTQCFVPFSAPIAESQEPYIFNNTNGVCSGLVNTLYVPPGNKFNASYAVFQEPFAIQREIEAELLRRLANLPPWVEASCQLALLRYLCSTVYLRPQIKLIGDAVDDSGLSGFKMNIEALFPGLLQEAVTIPSFTDREVCTHYGEVCAAFIVRANNPLLVPHCDEFIPGSSSVLKFPPGRQTVATVVARNIFTINFMSDPNNMTYFDQQRYEGNYFHQDAEGEPVQTCPTGYVVPEHPDNDQLQPVPGTACAIACA